MPSRRQLIQRANGVEREAQRQEEQAAAIDQQAYYWYNDGDEDGDCYKQAYVVKETKTFVFLKHWDWDEHTYRCRKSAFEVEGSAWGIDVFSFYRGDAARFHLLIQAASYRQTAERLRAQAASTPETQSPDPTTQAGVWLTMYYLTRNPRLPVARPLGGELRRAANDALRSLTLDDVLRRSVEGALSHAHTAEDYADLIDIAQTNRDATMVQMLRGEITFDDFFEILEITERRLNDCEAVASANWIREGF